MKNKNVFVSGGAGVIGSSLVKMLLDQGANVFVGDLKSCPKEWIGKLHYRQGDLNFITLEELEAFNPEIFFHLAATFERSIETYTFYEENFKNNCQLSHHLMHLFKQIHSLKRVVFASSYLIYDSNLYEFETKQHFPTVLSETSLIAPRNLCGSAKLMHEKELHFFNEFSKNSFTCISARIFRVYGRGSRDVISRFIRQALNNEELFVYRSEGQFDYIFADDVATGLIKIAASSATGIINLGTGRARSIEEVIEILNHYFPQLKIQRQPSDIRFEHSQASIEKLKQLTNWQPSHTLETAIPLLIDYEKQQLQLQTALNALKAPGILITSLSKKMPLIEAVRKAMKKIGFFDTLYGSDSNPYCIGSYGVDSFWQTPPLIDLTIDAIIDYCKKHQISLIIPTRNEDCLFFAKHASILKDHQLTAMVSSVETVNNCLDKLAFANFLGLKGFPVIPTALSTDLIEQNLLVVKERRGAGSANIGMNLTREEAMHFAHSLKEPIFQPFIEGKEWSVDVYCAFNGKFKASVARSRDIVINGESQVTTTAIYPALEQLCEAMATTLNLKGHAVFQVIEDENKNFHVIECNPRFGGASTASLAVGLESFFWFFSEQLGNKSQDVTFLRQQGEIRQIRYLTDRVYPWSSYLI